MVGKRGQSGWICLVGANDIVYEIKLPVVRRSAAIHTEKGKSSPAHTGQKRKVVVELEFRFE